MDDHDDDMTDTDNADASTCHRCIRYGDTVSLTAHIGRYLAVTRDGRVVGGSASQGEYGLRAPAADERFVVGGHVDGETLRAGDNHGMPSTCQDNHGMPSKCVKIITACRPRVKIITACRPRVSR